MPSSHPSETPSAISLRGLVKRFGPITAVDGLDLDVPFGTCVGLLGPNGAGKSTTMKALTAQVIADEGELEVLGYRLPEDSKQARAEMGVVPQLDNLDVSLTVEQNLLVFAHLYRVPAASARRRSSARSTIANLGDRRDSKVDQLSGGMRRRLLIARALLHQPRLVLLDEPTVGLDPQVRQELWALIDRLRSEGVSILMSTHYIEEAERLCDEVTIMSHGKAVAVGAPRALIAEHAGPEAIEVYGSPDAADRGRGDRPRARLAHAPHRHVGVDPARQRRHRPRRRAPRHQPRGRLRPAHRRGDQLMAVATRRSRRLGRLEPAALRGVMVREIVNFSSFWRSSTFSSTVDPTIYLLAFGFGFGSLVSTVARLRLHRLRRHRDRRHDGAVLRRLPRHVLDLRQVRVPAHLRRDPRRAGRHRGAGHRRGAVDRGARPASTAACRCSSPWSSAWTRAGACCWCPCIAALAGFGWACFGIFIAAKAKAIESFSYWQSGLLTPMFLVAGTFFPLDELPKWAQVLGHLNPLFHCVELVRARGLRLRGLGGRRPPGVPDRVRARVVAPGDPFHGAQADPLSSAARSPMFSRGRLRSSGVT